MINQLIFFIVATVLMCLVGAVVALWCKFRRW